MVDAAAGVEHRSVFRLAEGVAAGVAVGNRRTAASPRSPRNPRSASPTVTPVKRVLMMGMSVSEGVVEPEEAEEVGARVKARGGGARRGKPSNKTETAVSS